MADTKISALPVIAAGNELDSDQFACVQGGTTMMQIRSQIVSTVAGVAAGNTAALAAHVAVTTAPIHGSSAAAGANTLAHRNAAGDLAATDFNAVAGTAANPSHTFTVDPDTGLYRYAANELGIATLGTHRAHWNTTGALILNDAAASSKMTGPGVTIQQGAYDDEAVAIKSTDVAHGMTNYADTDTYAFAQKGEATSGGAVFVGLKDADGFAGMAAGLHGYLGEDADTTKTTAGRAIVEVHGFIRDAGTPTQKGNTNPDGNVFGIRTHRGGADVTLLLVDEDADLHVFNDIVVAGLVDGVDVAAVAAASTAHIATTTTPIHGSSVAAGANTLAHRDAAGRTQFVNPAAAQDASTKSYCDAQTHIAGYGALITPAGITDRTRTFFAPCVGGWEPTSGDPLMRTGLRGWTLPDGINAVGFSSFIVPDDFASGMTVTPVVVPGGTGNLRSAHTAVYGQCGEIYNVHSDNIAIGTTAVTVAENECIQQLALGNEAIGDIVNLDFWRYGNDALDTINTTVYFSGWIVAYTADS